MNRQIPCFTLVGVVLAMGAFSQSASASKGTEKNNPYTLTCSAAGGTAPAFSLDASAYSFQLAPPAIGSQGSGAGSGKVTFEPATVTVPASEVTTAIASALITGPFSSCSLIPADSASTLPSLTLQLVVVTGYSFVAPRGDDDDHAKFTGRVTISLQYGGIAIPASSGN